MTLGSKRRKGKREPAAGGVVLFVVGGTEEVDHPAVRAFPLIHRLPGEGEATHLARVLRGIEGAIVAGGTHLLVPREHADWLGDTPLLTDYFATYHELVEVGEETGIVFALRPHANEREREERGDPRLAATIARTGVDGVNVIGFSRLETGLGSATRGYVRALDQLGVPVALHDLSAGLGFGGEDATLRDAREARALDFAVNLICVNAREHYMVENDLGRRQFRGRRNIAVWHWEAPIFPTEWHDRFTHYDEIWVASSFVANIIAPISPIPIVRIPPAVASLDRASRARGRERLGIADDQFGFLFMFDFFSHFRRKNPLAIIEALGQAFSPADPVRLVIKCANEKQRRKEFARLQESAKQHNVTIVTGYREAPQVHDMMAACDAYVSLHRAEGLGLTMLEAMALGKPVIATDWSGNTDFMSVANSYPVRYTLVPLRQDVGPYPAGSLWAKPSVAHAAEQMRRVFDDRDEALAIGQAGRAEVAAHYSDAAIAHLIAQRLALIES